MNVSGITLIYKKILHENKTVYLNCVSCVSYISDYKWTFVHILLWLSWQSCNIIYVYTHHTYVHVYIMY